jgi:hypothetical protein
MQRDFRKLAGRGAIGMTLSLCALAAGCSDDDGGAASVTNVSAVVSDDISTVVHVRWTTETPSIGYVEYGPSEELGLTTPLESDETTEHSMTLLGLTADTVYHYRVVTWEGGGAGASDVNSIRTGDLPLGMPRLTLTGDGHDLFTIVPILGQKTAVTILDPRGEIVWYHSDDRELDFYRARISRDGKSVLYNAASVSGDPAENSELVRVALDGSETSSIAVPLLAHDFVEHEDGTLAAIAVEYRDFEGLDVPLQGNKIVEISPDGDQTTIWSAWDCFDPAEVQGDDFERGWTFANALDYDASEDAYYLGMRNFSSIAKIDRASGECEWVLGLNASTFTFAPGSARFLHQHQFQVRGNRILVMDNDGSIENESRVLEYELDFENDVATEVWRYTSDPTVYAFVLGEPTRLDDGGVFVNWSAAGQMERLDPQGSSIWKLITQAGYVFGFNTLAESLYPPSARKP